MDTFFILLTLFIMISCVKISIDDEADVVDDGDDDTS